MTKLQTSLILAIVLLTQSVQSKETTVRYFSKLVGIMSPFLEYMPRGEITKRQAQTFNHYRYEYDPQGRVVQISFFHGIYPSNDAYFRTHKVNYKYEKNKVTRSYFDRLGEPSSMWRHYYQGGELHQEVIEHKDGKRYATFFDLQGLRTETGLNTYSYESQRLDDHSFIQRQFKKDGSTNVLRKAIPFEVSLFTTDKHGYMYQIINIDPISHEKKLNDQAGYAEFRLIFDEYGNELGWETRDLDGKLVNDLEEGSGYARWLYQPNWRNRKLGLFNHFTENYFDQNEKRISVQGAYEVKIEFDDRGNTIGVSFYGEDGNLLDNPGSGYARLEIKRDQHGRQSERRYYDKSGNLRQQGNAVEQYQYDGKGVRSTVAVLDGKLQPISS